MLLETGADPRIHADEKMTSKELDDRQEKT